MELKEELEKLEALKSMDENEFDKQLSFIKENFNSPEEVRIIDDCLMQMLAGTAQKVDEFIEEANMKIKLANISQILSMSYIAAKYFKKTRTWMYQKVNGSIVNGRPVRFTQEEITTLKFALQDISKEIGSTVLTL